jgi:putative NIF3 family GTP cyclohydrolase 1 type 2
MTLKQIYQLLVKKGIEADIRSRNEIEKILKEKRQEYERLDKKKKELFDTDSFFNPFSDTRILAGNAESNIKSVIVGIDVDGAELLLVDRLKEQGVNIDLVISHHPAGRAYANFYEVMDLQIEVLCKEGVSLGVAQNLLGERKAEVERRVNAANHQRPVDMAKWLKINFLCVHTPADNLAYQYLRKTIEKNKPSTLADIIDILYTIPEYREAARVNNAPRIIIGNKHSRCRKFHLEFTGGTEGPKNIYDKLSSSGIDTIIAMHQSEEHYKKCKEANINLIFASHIPSDNLGMNLALDYLGSKDKIKIYEFSGFRRFPHSKK